MGTSYTDKGPQPQVGKYAGFDHVSFYVSNAKQVADWYIGRMGFRRIAYAGLETGSRELAKHVVRQNQVTFVFVSSLDPKNVDFPRELGLHGDGAKDVAFTVDDCRGIYAEAVKRGAVSVSEPQVLTDEHGTVVVATIRTYGDTTHTFVQRSGYTGDFMPGFRAVTDDEPFEKLTAPIGLVRVDHVVGNQSWDQMTPVADWYQNVLQFHRFWSVDDSEMHTEYSALSSIVVADYDEVVKMPINEPAAAKKKSQIEEYVDYYGGAGVQHIALFTEDIIHAVSSLRARGTKFLEIPSTYYSQLRERLADAPVTVAEDLAVLEKLHILVDFDDKGYLLQIFTQPVEDRPTLFYEIIQRRNHQGFGAGNFKALFISLERAQEERGNL